MTGNIMDSSNTFFWTFLYDFIRGPMTWISFIVFFAGTIFQFFKIYSLTRELDITQFTPGPGKILSVKKPEDEKTDWLTWLKLSIAGVNPFMTVVSTVFHVLLVIMPIFVLGHNILLDNSFGISLVSLSLPEGLSDFFTIIVIICAAIFLFRRMFLDRVKAITTWADYLFLFLAAAPFVTGFFAYHQVFDNYRLIIALHILFGELMLMAIPFTKFIHMVYFVIIRFNVLSEWGFGKGKRTW